MRNHPLSKKTTKYNLNIDLFHKLLALCMYLKVEEAMALCKQKQGSPHHHSYCETWWTLGIMGTIKQQWLRTKTASVECAFSLEQNTCAKTVQIRLIVVWVCETIVLNLTLVQPVWIILPKTGRNNEGLVRNTTNEISEYGAVEWQREWHYRVSTEKQNKMAAHCMTVKCHCYTTADCITRSKVVNTRSHTVQLQWIMYLKYRSWPTTRLCVNSDHWIRH